MKESKIYLAASYATKKTIQGYRDTLVSMGYTVTSRWIDQAGQHEKGDLPPDRYTSSPGECFEFAERDMEDIANSNVFIMFTGDEVGSGGRHTEFGMAFNYQGIETIVIIGPRENVFQCSPGIVQFYTFGDFVTAVEQGSAIAESRRRTEETIRNILGIPPSILGWESGVVLQFEDEFSCPGDSEINFSHPHMPIVLAEDGGHVIFLGHHEGEEKEDGSK